MSNKLSLSVEEIPMYFEDLSAAASTPLEPFAGVLDSILERVEERINGEEKGKDGEGEDEEEEGGWDAVIDGTDGSQIWFEREGGLP
ncbi:hypothetical protein DAPPUDRAFT_330960 [Daphnia pulex]|uniref:Uncharacterized protein n=1 Tax=Daphnia pulex TaxID=6669 RepID=E9HL36_DAPPU|nr:hypothetical protein DAPPUDRAFT_330960 [Daphnia pulex]|eukprot:EFX67535.1 hypothetical protein DAPPUDRAFT_330960 [Daphnia pulex]